MTLSLSLCPPPDGIHQPGFCSSRRWGVSLVLYQVIKARRGIRAYLVNHPSRRNKQCTHPNLASFISTTILSPVGMSHFCMACRSLALVCRTYVQHERPPAPPSPSPPPLPPPIAAPRLQGARRNTLSLVAQTGQYRENYYNIRTTDRAVYSIPDPQCRPDSAP